MEDFESTSYWTEEKENQFMNERRELHRKAVQEAGYKVPVSDRMLYRGNFEIPESLAEMTRIQEVLKRRKVVNFRLTDKVIIWCQYFLVMSEWMFSKMGMKSSIF